jgi:hypothetical protein
MHAGSTDERSMLVQGDGEPHIVTVPRTAEQNLGVFFGIRVRNAQSRSRDFSRANERDERLYIRSLKRPK